MRPSIDAVLAEAEARAKATEGWDFSYLDQRRHSEEPPWSYEAILRERCREAASLLDMDTGGGERLRTLRASCGRWPGRVCAIEAYQPNLPVARRNLEPLGIEVRFYEDREHLPLEGDSFDLIANRHGSYSVAELTRLLCGRGLFVTEQVGSDMCAGLNRLLGAPAETGAKWELSRAAAELEAAGFELVERREHRGSDRFGDIGAVVWYLTMVPWQIPGFSIDAYRERLYVLHDELEARGPIDAGNHHFLLVARRAPRETREGR